MKKLFRVLALILYYLLGKHLPKIELIPDIGCKLRQYLCKKIFRSCGKNLIIDKGVDFGRGQRLFVGNNVTIKRGVQINLNEDVIIGNNTYIGEEVIIYTQDHGHDRTDIPMQKQPYLREPVKIGENVKIGPRCIIVKGVTINNGVVVEPGSVVAKNVESNLRVAGIPAKEYVL